MESSLRRWLARGRALLLLALLIPAAGCSDRVQPAGPKPAELTLYAAASLRDVLSELKPRLEQEFGIELVINLGSSGDLARQIIAGDKADLFFSADEREMERLEALHMLAPGMRREVLSNTLVVIEPTGVASKFHAPFDSQQLCAPGIGRLSLANTDSVPAGRYARSWLESQSVWSALRERVLPGVDARAALAAVESGSVPAGIVYRTDSARSKKVRVVFVIPPEQGARIVYPCALLAGREQAVAARGVFQFLESAAAHAVYKRHGFSVLSESP
jgi:molybdate transport system substrate-binding protein